MPWLGDPPGFGHGAKPLLLVHPYLVVWLCSLVTFLAWLFLTLVWFDLRFDFVLSVTQAGALEFDDRIWGQSTS